MTELPRFSRSLRANLRLEIKRNIKQRPEDKIALKLWEDKQKNT